MLFSKSFGTAVISLLPFTLSAPIEKRDVLKASLEQAGNGAVKAVLTNTGPSDVSLLKYGTIFDDDAKVDKVVVAKDGSTVQFQGIHKYYKLDSLSESAFVSIPAGKSVETVADIAAVHDLKAGGTFDVSASGAVPIAKAGTTELSDTALVFDTKTTIEVDGASAAEAFDAHTGAIIRRTAALEKRGTLVQGSCSSSRYSTFRSAVSQAANLASSASSAASGGSASKFAEYFKTSPRGTVAARLNAVVAQARNTRGGTTYYCDDYYDSCSPNVLAYTYPSLNAIANCDLVYTLPVLTRTCHAQDIATTVLHEYTHAPATYSPGTQDYAYGYSASTRLSASQALNNADSYSLYANALYVGC